MGYSSIIRSPYKLICAFCWQLVKLGNKGRSYMLSARLSLPRTVKIGDVRVNGTNLTVGEHTYFNSGHIATAPDASVSIGRWCAIGYNVTILAITHDAGIPTGPEEKRPVKKGDVTIGDGVWIGSNVIIAPGVTIGRQSVVGGNSVVVKDLPAHAVCSGIPCKALYLKDENDITSHYELIK